MSIEEDRIKRLRIGLNMLYGLCDYDEIIYELIMCKGCKMCCKEVEGDVEVGSCMKGRYKDIR